MWTWFKDIIFGVIQFFYNFCGDWGMAIIIVTIIIRLLLTPITHKQFKSSYEMAKLQPKIKAIQDKYGNDKERLNEETMKLYADHKYNPLAGCLPMIIQMPIFIALYQVIQEDVKSGSFYSFIPDLAKAPSAVFSFSYDGFVAAIPYIVLVLFFAVSTLIPMLLQKNSTKQTKMIGAYMSIVMLWFGWIAPAAVVLYWDTSSLIGIGQQVFIQKRLEHRDKELAEEAIDITPIKVDVQRKEKKAKPTKNH